MIETLPEESVELAVVFIGIGIFVIVYGIADVLVTLALKFKCVNNAVKSFGFNIE